MHNYCCSSTYKITEDFICYRSKFLPNFVIFKSIMSTLRALQRNVIIFFAGLQGNLDDNSRKIENIITFEAIYGGEFLR